MSFDRALCRSFQYQTPSHVWNAGRGYGGLVVRRSATCWFEKKNCSLSWNRPFNEPEWSVQRLRRLQLVWALESAILRNRHQDPLKELALVVFELEMKFPLVGKLLSMRLHRLHRLHPGLWQRIRLGFSRMSCVATECWKPPVCQLLRDDMWWR